MDTNGPAEVMVASAAAGAALTSAMSATNTAAEQYRPDIVLTISGAEAELADANPEAEKNSNQQ